MVLATAPIAVIYSEGFNWFTQLSRERALLSGKIFQN
jgi:hypothetical protein